MSSCQRLTLRKRTQFTAVASNRPTEALASVISFTFVVYSHLIPRKRTQPWTDCVGHKSSMDIASVISFFWLRPCNSIDKYKYMKDLFMSPYRSFTYLPFSNYLSRHPSHLFPTHLPFSKLCYVVDISLINTFPSLSYKLINITSFPALQVY